MLNDRKDIFWYCPPCAVKTKSAWGKEVAVRECCESLMETVSTKLAEMEDKIEKRLAILPKPEDVPGNNDDGTARCWADLFRPVENEPNPEVTKNIARVAVQEHVKESKDREDRDQNLVIFRVDESKKADPEMRQKDDAKFFDTLCKDHLEVGQIQVEKVIRLGKKEDGKSRPMRITLKDKQDKRKIMSRLYRLKDAEQRFNNISVQNDMTQEEREKTKELLAVAKKKNEEEPSETHIYKVRGPPWDQQVVRLKLNKKGTA